MIETELEAEVNENQSAFVALAASGLALLGAVLVFLVLAPAGWLAGVGVVLVAVGAFTGSRGPVGVGVGILAVASLFATNEGTSAQTLGISAAMAVICVGVLTITDLSFAMRRATVVVPETMQGFFGVHAVASLFGIVLAVVLVSAVVAVSWPGWLLLLPGVLLGVGSIVLARYASRYNRKVRTANAPPTMARMPPPPPPGIRSTMPPPPAPGAQPTRLPPPPPPAPNQRSLR